MAFDRATLPWHAAQVVRAGEAHGGLVLFRRSVRRTRLRSAGPAAHGLLELGRASVGLVQSYRLLADGTVNEGRKVVTDLREDRLEDYPLRPARRPTGTRKIPCTPFSPGSWTTS